MKPSMMQCLTSSRRLKWLLLLECTAALWGVHALWQHKMENERSLAYYRFQEHQWRVLHQAISVIPHDLPAQMLYEDGTIVGMRLQQSMALNDWRSLIDQLQKRFWLTPIAVAWRREGSLWFADITWRFVRPSALKPEINILPFDLQQEWPAKGFLVSTLHGQRAAALIQVNQQEKWLYEGSWLPQLQATLAQVDQEYVVLQNAQGETRQLHLGVSYAPNTRLAKEP